MKLTITIPLPNITAPLRFWKWGLLALLAIAVMFAWSRQDSQPAEAAAVFVNINKYDRITGKLVGGSCFEIWDSTNTIRLLKVCDNDPAYDQNPVDGMIRVKAAPGLLHVIEQTPPPGYNLKPIKWQCELIASTDCFVDVPNDPKPSEINITKQDSVVPVLLEGACFQVYDWQQLPLFQICDNDYQQGFPQSHAVCGVDGTLECEDIDLTKGLIRVTVATGVYSVQESKPPVGYNPDPAKQPCDTNPSAKCELFFYNEWKPSEINITKMSVAVPLPDTCFRVEDELNTTELFWVCDNDAQPPPDTAPGICDVDGTPECEDADPADGYIRVAVLPGNYSVVEIKPPLNHNPDPTKHPCAAVGGSKCELLFENVAKTHPWFPWDINGDNYVDLPNDILGVILHYQQGKPKP